MPDHFLDDQIDRDRGRRGRPTFGWERVTPPNSTSSATRSPVSPMRRSDELSVSRNGVTTHLGQVYAKLGVRGRTELAATFAERLPTT